MEAQVSMDCEVVDDSMTRFLRLFGLMSGVNVGLRCQELEVKRPHPPYFFFGFYRFSSFNIHANTDHVSYRIGGIECADTMPIQGRFLVAMRPQEACQTENPDKPQDRFPSIPTTDAQDGVELDGRADAQPRSSCFETCGP